MGDHVYFNKKELKIILRDRVFPLIAAFFLGIDIAMLRAGANPVILLPLMTFMGAGTVYGFYCAYKVLVKSVAESNAEPPTLEPHTED